MKIGIIGSGDVGKTLSVGFKKYGHEVMIGTEHMDKLTEWHNRHKHIEVGHFDSAASFGDIVVLAVKGSAAKEVVDKVKGLLKGKIVIDATNPISGAPDDGVLPFYTSLNKSQMEELQINFPDIKFVKALNSIGIGVMVDNDFNGEKPSMFICGNDSDAKKQVTKILDEFGYEVEDMGGVKAARAIEPLCILWCIPGFLNNEWSHAFKLLKK